MEFLVFQHVPHEHPGLITAWADERGVKIKIVDFWNEYKIPDILNFNALVIMGGPMGVYEGIDVFPSKRDELTAIREAAGRVPMVGFCLGSQLIAKAFGGEVYPNIVEGEKVKEIGYLKVDLTKEGLEDPLFKGFKTPVEVLQWHGDAFDLPEGARLLATSKDCKNQAFCFEENAYGMLFHNEFTPEMIRTQIRIDRDWIHDDYQLDERRLEEQAVQKAPQMRQRCFRLMDNFLEIVKGNGKNS